MKKAHKWQKSVVPMDFSVKTTGHVRRQPVILTQPKEAFP
jgi:hypothetical protein